MTHKHFDWIINEHIGWHIVAGHGSIPADQPVALFDIGGDLVFVDCANEYKCTHCGECLGCLRKIAASFFKEANDELVGVDIQKEPWKLEAAKLTIESALGCKKSPDGAHHV